MLWAGYYNNLLLNNKLSLASDIQIRTKNWDQQFYQGLVRTGLNYKFNSHLSITGGFAFFKNAQYADKDLLLKNEWRPWQELSYQAKIKKINFSQRLRTEQRFMQLVSNGEKSKNYQYIFRLRYRFEGQFPLLKDEIIFLIANEIMVNPGYLNNKLFFDQNRSFAGLNFKMNAHTALQLQYVKIFQWHSNTDIMEDQNVIRINILQQFNFRKK